MINIKEDHSLKIAEYLLQIKAIKIHPKKPFTWTSGWKSPIYCDNRKALSYPTIRTHIRQQLANAIVEEFGKVDVIIGVATAGLPQGALVAEQLGLPFAYVRPAPKEHGLKNLIEGELNSGNTTVIIEDLISTGGSSLKAVAAVREAGCQVKGIATIFSYDFKVMQKNFKEAKCKLISLCNYDTLIKQAIKSKYIEEEDIHTLKKWREDPENWGKTLVEV